MGKKQFITKKYYQRLPLAKAAIEEYRRDVGSTIFPPYQWLANKLELKSTSGIAKILEDLDIYGFLDKPTELPATRNPQISDLIGITSQLRNQGFSWTEIQAAIRTGWLKAA